MRTKLLVRSLAAALCLVARVAWALKEGRTAR